MADCDLNLSTGKANSTLKGKSAGMHSFLLEEWNTAKALPALITQSVGNKPLTVSVYDTWIVHAYL